MFSSTVFRIHKPLYIHNAPSRPVHSISALMPSRSQGREWRLRGLHVPCYSLRDSCRCHLEFGSRKWIICAQGRLRLEMVRALIAYPTPLSLPPGLLGPSCSSFLLYSLLPLSLPLPPLIPLSPPSLLPPSFPRPRRRRPSIPTRISSADRNEIRS